MASIVVIDDDSLVRQSACIILENAGHQVLTAQNGAIGLELCRQEPTDLVVTDMLMPEKGGMEVLLHLQKAQPHIKVIVITGGGDQGDLNLLDHAELLGAVVCLQKPLTRQSLLEAVDEALNSGP